MVENWRGLPIYSLQENSKHLECRFERARDKRSVSVSHNFLIFAPLDSVYPADERMRQLANRLGNIVYKHCRQRSRLPMTIGLVTFQVHANYGRGAGHDQFTTMVAQGTLQNPYFKARRHLFQQVSRYNLELVGPFANYTDTPQILKDGLRQGLPSSRIAAMRTKYLAEKRAAETEAARRRAEQARLAEQRRAEAERQRIAQQAALANGSAVTGKSREAATQTILSIMNNVVSIDSRQWIINRYEQGTMRNLRTGFVKYHLGGFGITYTADYTFNRNRKGSVTFYMANDRIYCIKYWDAKCRDPYSSKNPNYNKLFANLAAAAIVLKASK